MDVHFYLNEKEVPKVFFKKFSSRCDIWLIAIDKYKSMLENRSSYLKLNYIPSRNEVMPLYDESDVVLARLHEEVIRYNE